MRPILEIIIHHSATKDSGTVSWDAIRRYHMEDRGWSDIGYHYGIELVGSVYTVMVGRPEHIAGAHTVGRNAQSLGFCFVGDYDKESPPRPMLEGAAAAVLLPWCRRYNIHPERIRPHSEFANKTCPGRLFPMDELRAIVAKLLSS